MILKPFCIWGPSHGCYRAHNLGNLITRSTVSNLLPVTVYAYMSVSEYLCTLYISQVRIPYLFKSIVVLKHDTISMRCGESGPKLGKCWNNADNSGHPLLTMLLVENAHGLPHDRSENMLSRLPWDSLKLSTSSEEKLETWFCCSEVRDRIEKLLWTIVQANHPSFGQWTQMC